MSFNDPVRIQGLRELQAALKQMDGESQKQLRVALNSVAETVVAGAARRVPRKTGRAAASLRARSSQREAAITGGSKKVPYYGWLDFGGRVGRNKTVNRPVVKSGRYLWPTIAANRESLEKGLTTALADAARQAGFEVDVNGS